jgi:glycosyltransferase involved in cell wall biosynthesis
LEFCLSPSQGGLELYVVKITRQLRAQGFPVESITRANTFLSKSLAGKYHASIDYRSFFGTFVAAKRTVRYLDFHQIDIVHIHWGDDLLHAVLAKKWARRPVYLIYSRQMRISRSKHDHYHRFLYKHVDILTVITENLLKEARRNLPMDEERIRLLRYGITPAKQVIDCKRFLEEVGLEKGRYTIGCFSRREHAKGQHVLINALRRLEAE